MNIRPAGHIEMPIRGNNFTPEVTDNDAPPSENCSADEFVADQRPARAENVDRQPSWSERIQQTNQKGWVGFALRWVPIAALCVTVMGGVFAYMNHKALDAQRTLNLVKSLQPVLINAHTSIMSSLRDIQDSLKAMKSSNTTGAPPQSG